MSRFGTIVIGILQQFGIVAPTTGETNYYVGEAVSKKFNNNTVNYYVGENIQQI